MLDHILYQKKSENILTPIVQVLEWRMIFT